MLNRLFLPAALATVLFAACSSNDSEIDLTNPDAIKNEAIAEANKDIPLTESPILGTLPSLYARQQAAKDSTLALTRNKQKELNEKTNDPEAHETSKKIASAWNTAYKEIESYYKDIMQEELNKLAGKEIPLEFDPSEFTSGRAVITDRLVSNEIYIDYSMVLARNLSHSDDRGLKFEYLDKDGNIIKSTTTTNKVWPNTYDESGTSIVQAIRGATWKANYSFYIPNGAEMASIRISFNKR